MQEHESRFDGSGFIMLDATNYYTEGETSSISLKLKPEKLTGLVLYLANQAGDQYIALELKKGYLSFKFSVGSKTVEVRSPAPLALQTWYNIKMDRQGMVGSLTVDGNQVAQEGSPDDDGVYQMMTSLYIGGLPGGLTVPVMNQGFAGCISHVMIEPDHVDMEKNMESENVLPSCKVEVKNTLSFSEGNPGHVRMPKAVMNGSLTFSFMFRTRATNGLLFYMVDDTNMFYVSLSMQDGALYLYAHPDNELITTDLQSQPTRFNDNKWHIVSVSIQETPSYRILMHLDDYYVIAPAEVTNIPLLAPGTAYDLYYGGLPENLRPLMSGVAKHEGPFMGCIRDAIVGGVYQDFQAAESIAGASLGECGSTDIVTILPPPKTTVEDTEDVEDSATEEFDPRDLFTGGSGAASKAFGQCKLPASPAYDTDLSAESGMRFGMKNDSFIEYVKKKLPEQMKEKSRFDLEFKTTHENGIILFMKDNERSDFFALLIRNGHLVFSFDCGSGPSKLETEFRVDDGQWHSVDFSRIGNEGKLVFDSREVKVPDAGRFSFSSTKIMEVSPNLYLGGLDEDMAANGDIKRKLEFNGRASVPGFIGCLRKIRFEVTRNNKRKMRPLGRWTKNNHVIPCSNKVENGYFFGPDGSRIKAFKRFRVGIDFDVSMMIKPRNITGLLLAVRGRRDSVVLQLVDGAIQFVVDNGRGPISATFKPDDRFQFCNGEWHEIQGRLISVK